LNNVNMPLDKLEALDSFKRSKTTSELE
jgi:hypothetical protein